MRVDQLPKKVGDGSQVGAVLQPVRCRRVPQRVDVYPIEAGLLRRGRDRAENVPRINRPARLSGEDMPGVLPDVRGSHALLELGRAMAPHNVRRRAPQRDGASGFLCLRMGADELEAMAEGRDDLLAAAAGSILGSYLSRPGSTHPQAVYSVALLVLAGADVERIVEYVDRARQRSRDGYRPR